MKSEYAREAGAGKRAQNNGREGGYGKTFSLDQ